MYPITVYKGVILVNIYYLSIQRGYTCKYLHLIGDTFFLPQTDPYAIIKWKEIRLRTGSHYVSGSYWVGYKNKMGFIMQVDWVTGIFACIHIDFNMD